MLIQDNITNSRLSKIYYIRFLVLGSIFSLVFALFLFALDLKIATLVAILAFLSLNALLFPFSRYAIDTLIRFAFNDGLLIKSEFGALVINFYLWALSIVIAPFYFLGFFLKKITK